MKLVNAILLLIALAGLTACKGSETKEEKAQKKSEKVVAGGNSTVAWLNNQPKEMTEQGLVNLLEDENGKVYAELIGESAAEVESAKAAMQNYIEVASGFLKDFEGSQYKITGAQYLRENIAAYQALLNKLNKR